MKKFSILWIISLFPALLWARTYTPQEVPNPKSNGQQYYVANPDDILSSDEVAYLNRCAQMLEDSMQAELSVVAIESIGEQDMFDFTYRLFQLWGIGKEGKNTGVLICFVLASHDIRIMTGQGIEGVLPDAVCKRIIDEDMIPSFRQEKYGEGLCLGVLRIYEICSSGDAPTELLNMRSATRRSASQNSTAFDEIINILIVWGTILGAIAFVIGITWCITYRRKKCPKCGKHTCRTRTQTLVAATYSATGIGLSTRTCTHCGYTSQHRFTIPRLTRTTYHGGGSMGGGFGGFSGGSFGGGSTMGGGAGGKW